jgi:hypothetical protein
MKKFESDVDGKDWLDAELADMLDEDYELELSEPALREEIRKIYNKTHPPTVERTQYFRHLLALTPVPHEEITLPSRVCDPNYERHNLPPQLYVPQKY